MNRISIPALVIAFFAELVADQIIGNTIAWILGFGRVGSGMSNDEAQKIYEEILKGDSFLTFTVIFGTATTVGGGYLAARIAKQYPYYHGLAMGLLGLALQLFLWRLNPLWMNILSVITLIPMSIYGAHLAKRGLPPAV